MPTFILEERKSGKLWQKVPELGTHQADSRQKATELIVDEMKIINAIDMVFCSSLDTSTLTFSPERIEGSNWRIRKIR